MNDIAVMTRAIVRAKRKGKTMIRKSTAIWRGDALHGSGALTTRSGAFREQPYSFRTRFQSEDGKAGTNPEELRIDTAKFQTIAESAKRECPLSKALATTTITLSATLF
jgi:organic hydroperoxide reductase OsmC/OhrA